MRMRTHHHRQCNVGENQRVRVAQIVRGVRSTLFVWLLTWGLLAHAGAQRPEVLADSVRTLLRQSILASAPMQRPFFSANYNCHIQDFKNRTGLELKIMRKIAL